MHYKCIRSTRCALDARKGSAIIPGENFSWKSRLGSPIPLEDVYVDPAVLCMVLKQGRLISRLAV